MDEIKKLLLDFNSLIIEYKELFIVGEIQDTIFLGIVYIIIFNILISFLFFNKYLKILFFVPGTIVHETWHFLFSMIFNGKPVSFTIIPRFEGEKIVLGSVSSRNITWYNAFLIAFAPLMSFVVAFYIYRDYLGPSDPLLFTGLSLLIAIIVRNAIPSTTDFKLAFKYSLTALLLVGLAFYILNSGNIYIDRILYEVNILIDKILRLQ